MKLENIAINKIKKEEFIINKIIVVDAPCGYGKTSWAIQYMNDHPENSFIYCTPFLDEIDRIRLACGAYQRFKEPIPYTGSKIDDFNELLAAGEDIAVTHMTFLNATPETLELIRMGEYTLIIDEELDVVEDFNNVQSVERSPRQGVTKEDIRMLLDNDIIRLEGNRVIWHGGEYGIDCKFSAVQKMAKLNRLYLVGDVFLIAVFPPEMFEYFNEIYILTYMFGGSIFKNYLDTFKITYDFASVSNENGEYNLIPYTDEYDKSFREKCKDLITICDNKRMIMYKKGNLSKSWYANAVRDGSIEILKCHVTNFFKNQAHAKASDGGIMWTCPKEYKSSLSGKGYTCRRKMTAEEKKLPEGQKDDIEKRLSCFVPCNARATNIYRDRWALAYCFNMYMNPMIRRFFTESDTGIYPDENLYSLSCMLQWILRSRLRDGKSIVIYIPSIRMRELLQRWLDNDI